MAVITVVFMVDIMVDITTDFMTDMTVNPIITINTDVRQALHAQVEGMQQAGAVHPHVRVRYHRAGQAEAVPYRKETAEAVPQTAEAVP
jgi:hypothetical protein